MNCEFWYYSKSAIRNPQFRNPPQLPAEGGRNPYLNRLISSSTQTPLP